MTDLQKKGLINQPLPQRCYPSVFGTTGGKALGPVAFTAFKAEPGDFESGQEG
jgi:hypothetical protein